MNRIKNNCFIQVEWMKENYKESINNSQDHRVSYLTNQYNEQVCCTLNLRRDTDIFQQTAI